MQKRIVSLIIAAGLLCCPVVMADDVFVPEIENEGQIAEAEEVIEASAVVHESEIVRTVSPNLLGMCTEWISGQNVVKRGTTEWEDGLEEILSQMRHVYVGRTAGMSLNYFKWRTSVGPYNTREIPEPTFYGAQAPLEFGPVEWVKLHQMINPDSMFIVGMNVTGDTAQSNIDYAEFMLGDPETSEFGKLRTECGLTEPVKVVAFELGNEVDGQVDAETYVKLCKPIIEGVREKFPDAKFIACGKTYPLELQVDSMEWRNWHRTIYREIGEEIDYISHHAYYDGQRTAHIEKYLDMMKADEMELLGTDRIDFAFTEQAKWPGNYGQPGVPTDTNQLSGVLSTAEFLNRMYQRRDAAFANYFQFPSGDGTLLTSDWTVLAKENEKWYLSGIIPMFNMYGDALGQEVVKSEVISDSVYAQKTENDSQFTLNVMTDGEDGLTMILVNKSEKRTFNLDFTFENQYQLVSETVFTAPEITSQVVDARTENIFTTTTTEKNEPNFQTYQMQPKAVVNLRLKRMDSSSPVEGEEVTYEGKEQFDDLNGFWGKNEVNLLAEQGLVTGVDGKSFAPNQPLTRAELAAMLSRAILPAETTQVQQVFSDVPVDAWYAGDVYRAYLTGLICGVGGGRFAPDLTLQNQELVSIAVRAAQLYRTGTVSTDDSALKNWKYQDGIADWAYGNLVYGVNSGLLSRFYENGYFRPTDPATRGEAAVLIYRLWSMMGEEDTQ